MPEQTQNNQQQGQQIPMEALLLTIGELTVENRMLRAQAQQLNQALAHARQANDAVNAKTGETEG